METIKILSQQDLDRTYRRLAHQFMEPFDSVESVGIIGMQTRGVYIAKRIQRHIKNDYDIELPLGVLDVTFYRDDFRTKMKIPSVKVTEIPFDTFQKNLLLVDDVLFTGRTLRAAMDALMDFGRPASLSFCALVDRGHRELPVTANFIGRHIPTHRREEVRVMIDELDGEDAVYLVRFDEEEDEA